jgi:hypothetical protein
MDSQLTRFSVSGFFSIWQFFSICFFQHLAKNFAVCVGKESTRPSPLIPVNVSVIPTGASEGGSGNLEVFGCSKIRFLFYLYIELQKL